MWGTPLSIGQRQETPGARTMVATFDVLTDERWTHGLARTQSGTLYATQGVHSALTCPDSVRNGTIQRLDGTGGMQVVASGFRNPMYIRCHFSDDACLTAELGDDGGAAFGAREKLVMLHAGANYGFPCCTTTGHTTPDNTTGFDCASVSQEEATFPLNDTPFGHDWERNLWPLPFRGGIMVALHGSYYSVPRGLGARVVWAPSDPSTHAPSGTFQDLVRGWSLGSPTLNRPADIAFASDGRMFIADDAGNAVYWMAPVSLRMP